MWLRWIGGRVWEGVVHQTDGYFEDVVAEDKVGEAIPSALGAFFDALAGVEEGFPAVVEARHTGVVMDSQGEVWGEGRGMNQGLDMQTTARGLALY